MGGVVLLAGPGSSSWIMANALARAAIAGAALDAVVVNGTRIPSRSLLEAIEVPVLNLHGGITPHCRGVHGGYWALAGSDPERCGTSVHLVDAGVDTGAIVARARISPGAEDTFLTYPALQLAAGIPLMLEAVRQARAGTLESTPSSETGQQFYHPTLWGYWVTGLTRGVW